MLMLFIKVMTDCSNFYLQVQAQKLACNTLPA